MAKLIAAASLVAWLALQLPPGGPVIAVWYRGNAAGAPNIDDLAAIRALGFTGVTWPESQVAGLPELHRLAPKVDLTVVVRARPAHLTAGSAIAPGDQVDIRVGAVGSPTLTALAWRAISRGARVISFDAGQPTGSGVTDMNGVRPNWVRAAVGIARQVDANPALLEAARPASPPPRPIVPLPRGLEVQLLETERAWLIVATNTSAADLKGVVKMPAAVPAALWVSLADGETMSMLNQPGGPQWTVDVPAGGARVYVIDKTGRGTEVFSTDLGRLVPEVPLAPISPNLWKTPPSPSGPSPQARQARDLGRAVSGRRASPRARRRRRLESSRSAGRACRSGEAAWSPP